MAEIYGSGGLPFDPFTERQPVRARMVAIMEGKLDRRGLALISAPSRALAQGQIHELIATDDPEAGPGAKVDRIAYVGFFEVIRGGVVLAGDRVTSGTRELGQLAGYDLTHFPNHMNVVIYSRQRMPGSSLLQLGEEILISPGA